MQSAAEVNPTDEQYSEEDSEQYLTFKLDGEEYGVEILRVQGIQGLQKVTTIPNTPDYILGVINLRGEIVPVVDLRKRFSLESIEFSSTTVVIVVRMINEGKERTLGVVVDGVSEVYRFEHKNVQEPPEFGGKVNTEFLKGLASVDEKMVILLEIDHLVDFNDITSAVSAGTVE